ncbi:uncharacterized protein LOC108466150 [Gossypium arboreum]|uniref:uncharacterized protein LOC108466150 n=1 Tax=Gossypium arboreum TaxID=29729 RepID=UPI0008191CC8|nr:uncharacterized protein LOC108466150 [Gossypium arboreum]
MNFQTGSRFNPGDNPANPVIPDLDVAEKEKMRLESSRQLEERCRWLEEKFKALENADNRQGIDAKDLSLVPNLVLPHKFKMPEFEKYNGTTCPEVHITMFCRRMTGYVNNDQLLIHCFQDSLVGAAARWYNHLSRAKIGSCRDLAQAFMRQYNHREVSMQVQPPLLEKETTILFINTLKPSFITHMIGSTTKSFANIVMAGKMIEKAINGGKIEGETAKRLAPRRKDNEVNNTSSYNLKAITVSQPRATTIWQQDSQKQGSSSRQNSKKVSFTPIPVTYRKLYQSLFNAHAIVPFHLKPLQPPYPKWYDANAKCEYYTEILGHSIKNCTGFKKAVERLIKMGIVKFDDTPSTENPLPNHGDQGVNTIRDTGMRRIKKGMAEVRMPMKVIWEGMVKREMIIFKEGNRGGRDYYEFHAEEGHEIQECDEFRALVQSLMDNKELEFYEVGLDEGHICTLEGRPKNQRINRPRIIISLPRNNEVETQIAPKVIIHKPVSFSYKDNKRIPWNYDCNVTLQEKEDIDGASKEVQDEGSYTRSGKRYDVEGVRIEPAKAKAFDKGKGVEVLVNEPVKEKKAREFLKFLKHSEYSVVEQLRKQPYRISVLALLLSSEVHREALMKVLNETYVTNDISVNKLDRLVSNISADNFIYFNDDKIPPGGMRSAKALHITTRCKGYTLPSVLIDNGSALNVMPSSILNRLPIDRAVPSSLYQKLKLVADKRLITIKTEEDIIAVVTNNAPYVEANKEAIECSFHSLEFVNATFILKGNEVPVPRISKTTRMGLQLTIERGALLGKGLERYLQGGIQIPELKEKRNHFGLGFRPDHKQRRKEIEKRQERRRARLSGREVEWELMTFPHIS